MDEILVQNAQTYASRHQLQLAERLGFGIHGIIFRTEGNAETRQIATAVKAHRSLDGFLREVAVYQRLKEIGVINVLGFHVPQMLRYDDECRVIEMSIVTRPFVLDFAGAYLDRPPDFPKTLWAEWVVEKQEQFGDLWPQMQSVLAALEELDIYMVDVSPSNIAFKD